MHELPQVGLVKVWWGLSVGHFKMLAPMQSWAGWDQLCAGSALGNAEALGDTSSKVAAISIRPFSHFCYYSRGDPKRGLRGKTPG